ncbi:hypothetical protein [Spirilliplanes yamanashiensis]|nr:hypothetical protein [Spirilliplanes yamanashiensis]MDP9816198.1 hypothetical protein [Spirilliplanes yamanashiensis]
MGTSPKYQTTVAQPRNAMARSSSSRQASERAARPTGTRATAHMATTNASATGAATATGMDGGGPPPGVCSRTYPASAAYPAASSSRANPMARQKRWAAGANVTWARRRRTAA